jgi:hypothetical protein
MTRSLVAFLIALLALPAGAAAQRGGVFVDPETPAGTEYAIPLEEARRHGAGGEKGGANGGSGSQPLFGEGIERAPRASGARGGSAAGAAGGSGGGGESGVNGAREGRPAAGTGREARVSEEQESARDRRAAVAVKAATGGGSDTLLTAGIAAGVLAIGLLVGFGLRRLLRTE